MTDARGNFVPQIWILPPRAPKYEQCVVVNWLQVEVPQLSPMPVLGSLTRWRNREVFYFVKYEWPDWTARACR